MKKNICLAAGIAVLLLGNPPSDVHAEGRVRYHGWGGGPHWGWRDPYWGWGGPYWGWNEEYLVIDTRPSFIVLPGYGFSVSVGTPYDMIYYDKLYYIYNNNNWYSSRFYRGPWVVIEEDHLPDVIKHNRIEEIRKARNVESDNKKNKNDGNQDNRGHHGDINSGKNLNNSHGETPLHGNEKNDN